MINDRSFIDGTIFPVRDNEWECYASDLGLTAMPTRILCEGADPFTRCGYYLDGTVYQSGPTTLTVINDIK